VTTCCGVYSRWPTGRESSRASYLGVYLSGPPKQALTEFLWSILTLPLWVVVFKSYGL